MNVFGVVAEYNPFHMGHEYHLRRTRESCGEDCGIICVMSGNFVQRGEAAVFSKTVRAAAAVECGADLVLELPLPYALSSAEAFACGAVRLLHATGIVTHLSFGSETGDAAVLEETADVLLQPVVDDLCKELLKSGVSYAEARQKTAEKLLGERAEILRKPNNLLGVEYIKAIRRFAPEIIPTAVKRQGAGHDEISEGEILSATDIRYRMRNGGSLAGLVPDKALELYLREIEEGRGPVLMESLETAILSRLRMLDAEDFAQLPDAGEGLHNRLYAAVNDSGSVEEILSRTKTKRYPMSRLRRMLMCACTGVKNGMAKCPPPYLRVLAANSKGCEMLRSMDEKAMLPLITKPAHVRNLGEESLKFFEIESRAADLYVLAYGKSDKRRAGSEWRISPYITK